MKENILHYIWQHQYFDHASLQCTDGRELTIINKGIKNPNEGPDFECGKIKIDDIEWVGNIEVHVLSSDWKLHKHSTHAAYDNVILHVVYDHNYDVIAPDLSTIPTLILKNRVSNSLIQNCTNLIDNSQNIPCSSQIRQVNSLTLLSMLDRSVISRLERKSTLILQRLKSNKDDWEETAYQLLSQNFGFKVNAQPFLRLSQNLPLKILLKNVDNLTQIEALLFGMAGMLEGKCVDEYHQLLKYEFRFLAHKYDLELKIMNNSEWKFLRMRPTNFPTVRLSQLAVVIANCKCFFRLIIETNELAIFKKIFTVHQSDYWQAHYDFGKCTSRIQQGIGIQATETLIINTVCTLLSAYSIYINDSAYLDKAIGLLEQLPSETNNITKQWNEINIESKNAFDSQAQIELYNEYCAKKKCLNCAIGHELLKIV